MRAPFRKILYAIVGLFALALLIGVAYIVLPWLLVSTTGPEPEIALPVQTLIGSMRGIMGVIIFLLMALDGLIVAVTILLGITEILTGKNETGWKVLWGAVLFFFGIFGLLIYIGIARKELKE